MDNCNVKKKIVRKNVKYVNHIWVRKTCSKLKKKDSSTSEFLKLTSDDFACKQNTELSFSFQLSWATLSGIPVLSSL